MKTREEKILDRERQYLKTILNGITLEGEEEIVEELLDLIKEHHCLLRLVQPEKATREFPIELRVVSRRNRKR